MGHYDYAIEERERAEHEARARSLGITPGELTRRDAHRERMIRGKRLFDCRVQEESDMEYYLNHRHEPY